MYNTSYVPARTCDSTYKSYKMVSHKDEHWEQSDLTCLTLRLCEAPQHEKWVCIKSYLHFSPHYSSTQCWDITTSQFCQVLSKVQSNSEHTLPTYSVLSLHLLILTPFSVLLLALRGLFSPRLWDFLSWLFLLLVNFFFFLIQPIFLWWKLHELHNLFHLE